MSRPSPLVALCALVLLAGCPGGPDTGVGPEDRDGDGHAGAADCDEDDPARFVGAPETCNGVDDNCDGVVDSDDAEDAPTWFGDADGDGFGQWDAPLRACAEPEGAADNDQDCDDTDPDVFPGADEVCNGRDDDCDGVVDPSDSVDAGRWYPDGDADGFGSDATAAVSCAAPPGFLSTAGDCDDADPAVFPGADELCNGRDDDCDGETDPPDALDASTFYADVDGDGFGDPEAPVSACTLPYGAAMDAEDCDDTSAETSPDGLDLPDDGVDQDCYDGDLTCADGELRDRMGRDMGVATPVGDAWAPSCGEPDADDVGWHWVAPADGTYTFSAPGGVVALFEDACGGAEEACDGQGALTVHLAAGEERVVVVEGATGLSVDRVDEAACGDGADGDDGMADCLDPECDGRVECDTSRADVQFGSAVGVAVASGTTVGAGDDWPGSCGGGASEDVALAWVAPEAGTFVFTLAGSSYDSVLSLWTPDGAAELACNDDGHGKAAVVTWSARAGELVLLVVDGKGVDAEGSWVLGIY